MNHVHKVCCISIVHLLISEDNAGMRLSHMNRLRSHRQWSHTSALLSWHKLSGSGFYFIATNPSPFISLLLLVIAIVEFLGAKASISAYIVLYGLSRAYRRFGVGRFLHGISSDEDHYHIQTYWLINSCICRWAQTSTESVMKAAMCNLCGGQTARLML